MVAILLSAPSSRQLDLKTIVKLAANGLLVIRTSRIAGVGVVQTGIKADDTRLERTAGPGLNAPSAQHPIYNKVEACTLYSRLSCS